MEELKLVKEGNYWTLYIGEVNCGCGFYEDMIEVIADLKTPEDLEKYVKMLEVD